MFLSLRGILSVSTNDNQIPKVPFELWISEDEDACMIFF